MDWFRIGVLLGRCDGRIIGKRYVDFRGCSWSDDGLYVERESIGWGLIKDVGVL